MDKELSKNLNMDPNVFDISVKAILEGSGAGQYVEIFRKNNIGQSTLVELSNEDLIKLGVDDPKIRKKIIEDIETLPIYEELLSENHDSLDLNLDEVKELMAESAQQIYRIYLSIIAKKLALSKSNIYDCLLYRDLYASDIALNTIREIETILNAMELTIHTKLKVKASRKEKAKRKKIFVGVVGSGVIMALSVLLINSLKRL